MQKLWKNWMIGENVKADYGEEKHMNTIMFWEMIGVPIVAWIFAMCFVDGTKEDAIVLVMVVFSLLIRAVEEKLGKYAKYFYIAIMPIWGAVTIVVDHEGRFGAIDHAYIWSIIICVAGYDFSVFKLNILLTLGCNVAAFILFPEAYLKLHNLAVWIYIVLLYLLALITALSVYKRLYRQEQTMQQIRLYKRQMDIMQQTEKKVRGLRHDMKHHAQELSRLAKEERYEDILTYLRVMGEFVENPNEYVVSGNKEIDAICNFLLEKAANEGIEVEAISDIPEELRIPVFELNSILGNLLENATEAAVRSEKKKIQMEMYVKKGFFHIAIVNSYDGIVLKNGSEYASRKEGKSHGYGLRNVQEILKRNRGAMKIRHDKEMFRVDVVLYLDSKYSYL